jgi:3-oxosteroid 1-dehydrogenase
MKSPLPNRAHEDTASMHTHRSLTPPALTRRDFLEATAGLAVAAAGVGVSGVPVVSMVYAQERWDHEADVVVVGSGAAGASAALNAHRLGDRVLVLEKAAIFGGTTAKSGGTYWIPNNSFLQKQGVADPREDVLRYMTRVAYPLLYDPTDVHFGLPDDVYSLFNAFYDEGPAAIDALAGMQALDSMQATDDKQLLLDYYSELRENKVPRGRSLRPRRPDGADGKGSHLVQQTKAAVDRLGIPTWLGHRVTRLIVNRQREVVGVEATRSDGKALTVRARKATIFASGGFTHNRELRQSFLRGPIFGGCAVPTNEGDFISIAGAVGAKLTNMAQAWWCEIVLEQALELGSVANDIFNVPGDSMIIVNRHGRRVVNEKTTYNDRTQIHFLFTPAPREYPNLITFMVYDQRVADTFVGSFPIPKKGEAAAYVFSGKTFTELARAIDSRLAELAPRLGGLRLAPTFAGQLSESVGRFNSFAERGTDEDFHRGETPYELHGYSNPVGGGRNPTMHPIASTGPYYAIALAAGTLDTKGGPAINARAQVLDATNTPIRGLYGAGNCIGFGGQAYWAAGATLGPALTFGYIAAREAHAEAVKEIT